MTQEERKIKSKNKIMSIAEKEIGPAGLENTDIDEICRKAGLTKGAFYHHFHSKQQFILELLNKWVTEISEEVNSSAFEVMDTIDIFMYVIDKLKPMFEKAGSQLPVFLELYIKAINDIELKKIALIPYNSFIEFFSAVINDGIKKGSIKKDLDPIGTARILFALTAGLLLQGLLNPDVTDWTLAAKKSVRLILE